MKFKLILSILLLPIVSSITAMEWESTSEEETSSPLVIQGENLVGRLPELPSSMELAFGAAGPAEKEAEQHGAMAGADSSSDNSEDALPDQESAKKAKASGSSITGKKRKKSSIKDTDLSVPSRKKIRLADSKKLARRAAYARNRRAEKKKNAEDTAARLNRVRKEYDQQTKELAEKQAIIEQQAQEISALRYENEQLKQQLSLYQHNGFSVYPQIL